MNIPIYIFLPLVGTLLGTVIGIRMHKDFQQKKNNKK